MKKPSRLKIHNDAASLCKILGRAASRRSHGYDWMQAKRAPKERKRGGEKRKPTLVYKLCYSRFCYSSPLSREPSYSHTDGIPWNDPSCRYPPAWPDASCFGAWVYANDAGVFIVATQEVLRK